MHLFTTTVEAFMGWLSLHQEPTYFILFLGPYFETLIGPGFFIPGEIFFLPGAILAGSDVLNIWIVIILFYAGGILGDSSSYFIGRKTGSSVFKENKLLFNPKNYQRGENFFKKYGKKAIFLARLFGPLSWITPFLSGVFGIPYLQFLKYNIPGVIVGIGEFIVVGYFFGNKYQQILTIIQRYTLMTVVSTTIIISLIWYIRKMSKKTYEN